MEEKMTTVDIEHELRDMEDYSEELILNNPAPGFCDYLNEELEKAGVSRTKLIHSLNVDRSYGYQILNGTRIPTRENIIRIALVSQFSLEQTQRLLVLAQRCELYVRRPLDAKIVYCLEHKLPFNEAVKFIWGE